MGSYAKVPDDPGRMVPNPAKARMKKKLASARAALGAAKDATMTGALEGKSVPTAAIEEAEADLAELKAESAKVPAKVPLGDIRPDAVRLDDERKRLHDAVRMATWNAEHALAPPWGRTTPGRRTRPTAFSPKRSPPRPTSKSSATSSTCASSRSPLPVAAGPSLGSAPS
jgi:hypothetical protein